MLKPSAWLARIREVGSAFLAVLRAEFSTTLQEIGESGRGLMRAALFFTITIALGFWTVGLLVYFLVELLAQHLPRWGAVGIVFGLFLVATIVFALISVRRVRSIETPIAILDRRFRNHAAWWQQRVAGTLANDGLEAASEEPDEWNE
ncbi:MAG: phage holin family protein [Thermoanaerobaculia bacterium]